VLKPHPFLTGEMLETFDPGTQSWLFDSPQIIDGVVP
jgi:hypothetical protein